MMLHQIGWNSSWCQQKSSGIEERCWHQGRNMPRWCSIFSGLPSHHHEKTAKRYSIACQVLKTIFMHIRCLLGIYQCRHVALLKLSSCLRSSIHIRGIRSLRPRFFTNLLYFILKPLDFFTFPFPGEPVTLSPVFLAQYYPSEISIFDAKPPIFEAVTLYPPPLFFCKRPSDHALRHILNVTASYISPSVK